MPNDPWFFLFGALLIILLSIGGQAYVARLGRPNPKQSILTALVITILVVIVGAVLKASWGLILPLGGAAAAYTVWVLMFRCTRPRA